MYALSLSFIIYLLLLLLLLYILSVLLGTACLAAGIWGGDQFSAAGVLRPAGPLAQLAGPLRRRLLGAAALAALRLPHGLGKDEL